jgi:hypothetical protein
MRESSPEGGGRTHLERADRGIQCVTFDFDVCLLDTEEFASSGQAVDFEAKWWRELGMQSEPDVHLAAPLGRCTCLL